MTSTQVEALSELPGITPRMLLAAFKESLDGQEPSILEQEVQTTGDAPGLDPSELNAVLSEEWRARLVAAHEHLDQAEAQRTGADADRICDGLLLASRFDERATLRATNDEYIQLESKAGGRWVSLLHQGNHSSLGAALRRAVKQPASSPGLLVREQWRPFIPTWKATNQLLSEALARPHVDYHELTRQEAASLLALEEIHQAARSRDLCDARGRPLTEEQVRSHLREEVAPSNWAVVQRLVASSKDTAEIEDSSGTPATAAEATEMPKLSSESNDVPEEALAQELASVLRRLRVASVDRVIREVQRSRKEVGRLAIVAGLQKMEARVDWFGRNLIAWRGEA
jgi:hypothetical protein